MATIAGITKPCPGAGQVLKSLVRDDENVRSVQSQFGGQARKDSAMVSRTPASVAKKATVVSLSETLLVETKALRINVSQAAEAGIAKAVADRRAELSLKENAKAFDCWNNYVEKSGLPLERYRNF